MVIFGRVKLRRTTAEEVCLHSDMTELTDTDLRSLCTSTDFSVQPPLKVPCKSPDHIHLT
jgi:hypothetical protein